MRRLQGLRRLRDIGGSLWDVGVPWSGLRDVGGSEEDLGDSEESQGYAGVGGVSEG